MVTKLKPFQKKGVRKIHHFKGRALVADEMGLGKTVQALFYGKEVPECRPIIVVCPALHKWNWETEARDHIQMRGVVLEGRKPHTRKPLSRVPIIIINYDILSYWVEYLRSLNPRLIIVDEIQYIKNRLSKRTKATRMLCRGVKKVIGLGGTGGMDNRPSEIFPFLNIVRRDKFPSFWQFAMRYCGPKRRPWGWEFKGATNLEELHQTLQTTCMIRRLKKDVLKDLPPKTRKVIRVDMEKPREYEQIDSDFKRWARLRLKNNKKLKSAMRSQALVKIGHLKRTAAVQKLKAITEWIDNFLAENPDRKLIVFAVHKKLIIHHLRERYKKIGVSIDGDTSKEKRKEYFHRFNNEKKCRVLIGQLQAVGIAWSAKSCNNVLFAELGWTPAEHEQAEDRVHGLYRGVEGKKSFIYYLIAKGTIEERICALLEEKKAVMSAILDGTGRDMVDFDIHRRLIQEYAHAT